jgi:hypothetical protein
VARLIDAMRATLRKSIEVCRQAPCLSCGVECAAARALD